VALDDNGGTIVYRLRELERVTREIEKRADATERASTLHEEQINGAGGLLRSINSLREEVQSLKRALYTVGGGVVLAAIGAIFALGPHG
jgi:hypothetical protein